MAKYALTGHTGFIGSQLGRKLLDLGHEVFVFDRVYYPISGIERIYHLGCPSTNTFIQNNPTGVMDIIMDSTRKALRINKDALFINASSKGAEDITNDSAQNCYNLAKRCMEQYIQYSGVSYKNYRLPSVYGPGMHDDSFIKMCIDGVAYKPLEPNKKHFIAHIDAVVDAMINLNEIETEEITLGEIYDRFYKK